MTSDVLGVSISGLRVSQNAIRTAGHNIANANTEGYSRQNNEINAFAGSSSGVGYVGNGAYTAKIERIVNDFVTEQVRQDTSLYNELNAYDTNILQLNDLLSNDITGLTGGLESFFSALQNLTDDPTSVASRQLLLSESSGLADRFNTLYNRNSTIADGVNQGIETAVKSINALSSNIAQLNLRIAESFTNSTNSPNDLLDQRDEALRELSELVSVQTFEQDNQVNVTIGTGIPLIISHTVSELNLAKNEFDPLQTEIYLSGANQVITDSLSGGEIGGLLDFQTTVIEPTFNDLGRIGIVLADQFNQLQQEGITLNNTFGQNMFYDINEFSIATNRIFPSSDNQTSNQVMALTITDTTFLTTSDYHLSIDENSNTYSVTRLNDNADVASGTVPVVFPESIEFDGLSIDITAGTFASGDEFLLRPTRFESRNFSVNNLFPDDIALGSPVLTDTNLSNLGSAQISPGDVLGLVDEVGTALPLLSQTGQMSPPLIVKFTTPTTYDILDNSNPGNPIQLDPPIRNQVYTPGIENNLFADDIGQTTIVSNGTATGLPGGAPVAVNGYPAETYTFETRDSSTGSIISTQNILSTSNASARNTAGLLDNIDGVSATAFNYMELRDFNLTLTAPLQITVNGENLIEYNAGAIVSGVPVPTLNSGEDFNDYLAEQVNENENLGALGIYAVSAFDAVNNEFYIQIHSTKGDDFTLELAANGAETIEVNDGENADVLLSNGVSTVIGGYIDVTLNNDITMSTTPVISALFGDSTAVNFSQLSYLGIQANITGVPQSGDTFTIDFNSDADSDNRNGLKMVNLQQTNTIENNNQTFNESYNRLVETIGITANTSATNTDAAEKVLQQTTNLRDSISGVSLDEEAADLIRYEQLYSANTQVINVARELFDRLLNSF